MRRTTANMPIGVVVWLTVALVAAGCGGSDDDDAGGDTVETGSDAGEADVTPELQALIDGAEAESGTLTLNWGYTGVPESIDQWEAAFNERFGLDVDIQFTPEPSMPANFGTLAEEVQANRAPSSDAFVGTFPFLIDGGPQGLDIFETVDWAAIAPEWPDGVVSSDNSSVVMLHQTFGFAYNTQQLDEADLPQTVDDVVELAGNEPVASTPYAAGFNLLAVDEVLGEAGAQEHVEAFGAVQSGLIGCNDVDRIATGEFIGFWMNCGSNIIDVARETRGAPVDSIVLEDAAVTQPWMLAVPKSSANPNTAKLWIYFLLTPEAQDILYENGFVDNMLLEGSRTAEEIAEHEADGIEFVHFTYEYGLENPVVTDPEYNQTLITALTGQSG